jgi:hypothetical protein
MKKKIPIFETDEAAERFVETADLTDYDLSQFKPVRFELERKAARVNMRLPEPLLAAVKARARARLDRLRPALDRPRTAAATCCLSSPIPAASQSCAVAARKRTPSAAKRSACWLPTRVVPAVRPAAMMRFRVAMPRRASSAPAEAWTPPLGSSPRACVEPRGDRYQPREVLTCAGAPAAPPTPAHTGAPAARPSPAPETGRERRNVLRLDQTVGRR